MSTVLAQTPQPTPHAIDDAADAFLDLKKRIDEIEAEAAIKLKPLRERLSSLAEELKAWTSAFGSVHAKKSKLLTGLIYEAMSTVSSSTSLDQAAVGIFLKACKKAGKPKIFGKIFETLTVYRERPEADQIARTELEGAMSTSFIKCFLTKTNAPRLEVRPRKKEVS